MKLFTNKKKLREEIGKINNISFVPTMGFLHKGHESIIKKSVKGPGKTLVSIFAVSYTHLTLPTNREV